jgi:hypothetical protein
VEPRDLAARFDVDYMGQSTSIKRRREAGVVRIHKMDNLIRHASFVLNRISEQNLKGGLISPDLACVELIEGVEYMVLLHKLQVVFTLLELNSLRQFKTLELIDRQTTPSLKILS